MRTSGAHKRVTHEFFAVDGVSKTVSTGNIADNDRNIGLNHI